jgi:hypothetical protein
MQELSDAEVKEAVRRGDEGAYYEMMARKWDAAAAVLLRLHRGWLRGELLVACVIKVMRLARDDVLSADDDLDAIVQRAALAVAEALRRSRAGSE